MDVAPQDNAQTRISPFNAASTATANLVGNLYWNQRFYLAFLIMGSVYVLSAVFLPEARTSTFLTLITVTGMVAASIDVYRIYAWIFSFTLGKALLAAAYALTANVALGWAGVTINSMTATDAVELPLTRNVLAILLIPLLAAVASIFLSLIGIVLASFYLMVSLAFQDTNPQKSRAYIESTLPFPTFIARCALIFLFVNSIPTLNHMMKTHEENLKQAGAFFAYHFEALRHTRCVLASNQAAVKGQDREYMIITKNDAGYEFKEQVCPQP